MPGSGATGRVKPVLLSPCKDAGGLWGLRLYGSTRYEFCAALDVDRGGLGDDVRPLVHEVMDAFWCDSAQAEAVVWASLSLRQRPSRDCSPTVVWPFMDQDCAGRGDRPWLVGSRLEHAESPIGVPQTCFATRARWCAGDGLTHQGSMAVLDLTLALPVRPVRQRRRIGRREWPLWAGPTGPWPL
jgi:hypothetical protein